MTKAGLQLQPSSRITEPVGAMASTNSLDVVNNASDGVTVSSSFF